MSAFQKTQAPTSAAGSDPTVTDTEGTGMNAPVQANDLLNAQTVRDQTAGQRVLTHLLDVGNDRHHLQRHLQELDAAFISSSRTNKMP
jgi:hypothetical protein